MLNGPVSIVLTPTGDIRVLIDDAYMDPLMPAEFARISTGIMKPRRRLDCPTPAPGTEVRIHRVSDAGGLVAVDVTPAAIDFLVDKDALRSGLVAPLSAHGTRIMRHFT